MKTMMFAGLFTLATAACTHAPEHTTAVAQVDGDQHVVVRAEAGRIWWSHRAWTEPHELWTLPADGKVEKLTVARQSDGFVVSFEQNGVSWTGRFGEQPQEEQTATTTELAKREP